MAQDSKESDYFLDWARAAFAEGSKLLKKAGSTELSALPLESDVLQPVSVKYVQLQRCHPDLSALRPPQDDPDYKPGRYETYKSNDTNYCINPRGTHFRICEPYSWPLTFELVIFVNDDDELRLSCTKMPSKCDVGAFSRIKPNSRVIKIERLQSLRAVVYVGKRSIVDGLSKHTRWNPSSELGVPTTDKAALEVLLELAGDDWRTVDGRIHGIATVFRPPTTARSMS